MFVDGKPVPANQIVFKGGITYADAALLAQAPGASVQNSEGSVIIRTEEKPSPPTCEKVVVEGEHFSEQFRSDVAGVANEIESLRAAVLKMEKVALGPRFDAIDRRLTLSPRTHKPTLTRRYITPCHLRAIRWLFRITKNRGVLRRRRHRKTNSIR